MFTKFLDKGTHSHYKIIPAKTCPSRKKTFLKENVKQMLTLCTKKYFQNLEYPKNIGIDCQAPFTPKTFYLLKIKSNIFCVKCFNFGSFDNKNYFFKITYSFNFISVTFLNPKEEK